MALRSISGVPAGLRLWQQLGLSPDASVLLRKAEDEYRWRSELRWSLWKEKGGAAHQGSLLPLHVFPAKLNKLREKRLAVYLQMLRWRNRLRTAALLAPIGSYACVYAPCGYYTESAIAAIASGGVVGACAWGAALVTEKQRKRYNSLLRHFVHGTIVSLTPAQQLSLGSQTFPPSVYVVSTEARALFSDPDNLPYLVNAGSSTPISALPLNWTASGEEGKQIYPLPKE